MSSMNGLGRPTAPQGDRFDMSPVASSASAVPASFDEEDLFYAHRNIGDGTVRRPCVCGGVVRANPAAPARGVQAHNYSGRHKAWRANREP